MVFHGFQWFSMVFHGFQDFHSFSKFFVCVFDPPMPLPKEKQDWTKINNNRFVFFRKLQFGHKRSFALLRFRDVAHGIAIKRPRRMMGPNLGNLIFWSLGPPLLASGSNIPVSIIQNLEIWIRVATMRFLMKNYWEWYGQALGMMD